MGSSDMMGDATGIFRIDAGLLAGDSPAFFIWLELLKYANVGLVVFLLVVVFSQLTGRGIDNYGIKKILPKLITAAILINISFVVCQLAVDTSNIIGNGVVQLARDIKDRVMELSGWDYLELTFGGIFTLLFAGAGAAGAAVGIAAAALTSPIWWIPLLIVAIAGLIAFLMFWLMLAGRQLLAVILVAVSPIAMLCYALPNTNKIFKKWVDLFKGVLVVYPICGAMYGVSILMKIIAYQAEGMHILMVMVAMLMTFLPLYAAPMLIKKSLAAFSTIGGMLSGVGSLVKSGTKKGFEGYNKTEMAKNRERAALQRRAENNIRANEAIRRAREEGVKASRRDRIRNMLAGGDRGIARSQALIDKYRTEDVDAEAALMRDDTGGYNRQIMEEQLSNLFKTMDAENYERDTNPEVRRYNEMRAQALMSKLATVQGGGKALQGIADFGSAKTAKMMGDYMARDAQVAKALGNKSQRTTQRLADIAAGVVDDNITQDEYDRLNDARLAYRRRQKAAGNNPNDLTGYDQWVAEQQAIAQRQGKTFDTNSTVIQRIANADLDKDKDLVTQSGGDVKKLIEHLSEDRIIKIANNATLFGYGDVAEGVERTFKAKAAEIQARRTRADALNNGTPAGVDNVPE